MGLVNLLGEQLVNDGVSVSKISVDAERPQSQYLIIESYDVFVKFLFDQNKPKLNLNWCF